MENVKKLWNGFKTGIVTLVLAYLFLYVVAINVNDLETYKMQILKMAEGDNFFKQFLVAGAAYMVLEVYVLDFFQRISKAVDKKELKEAVKNILYALFIIAGEVLVLSVIDIKEIISDEIFSTIIFLLIIKCIFVVIVQNIDAYKINKKLNELNNKE